MAHRRRPRRSDAPPSDPFAALGLTSAATADDVRAARNRLAKQRHPDVGGSHDAMQAVNDAAAAALVAIDSRREAPVVRPPEPAPATPLRHDGGMPSSRFVRDHPSFTIEALPADAYEAVLIAASVLGQIADDDPPYRLDVLLAEPLDTWCRLELVPDGGGSTVSLTVSAPPGERLRTDVGEIRDRFVAELNQLDWRDDGPRRRPGE